MDYSRLLRISRESKSIWVRERERELGILYVCIHVEHHHHRVVNCRSSKDFIVICWNIDDWSLNVIILKEDDEEEEKVAKRSKINDEVMRTGKKEIVKVWWNVHQEKEGSLIIRYEMIIQKSFFGWILEPTTSLQLSLKNVTLALLSVRDTHTN